VSREAPTLSPGDLLAGRFEILSFLGEGSMGEVYAATDHRLDEEVAVKLLRPEIARDDEAVQRFKREVQLARRVTHPHVCRIFDLFVHTGGDADGSRAGPRRTGPEPAAGGSRSFVSMELLHGESLAQLLERQGRLSAAEALPIACQMAEALGAAHAARVIHRDFKTANVMLVPSPGPPPAVPRAVITDFGLARHRDVASAAAPEALIGSPAYMAPEQVRGGEITPATDFYALGVVLFEMLTGRLPFEADTTIGLALKRLHEPPPRLRDHLPEIDERWETVIDGCLAADPGERFASPAQVLSQLHGRRKEDRRRALPRRRLLPLAVGALLILAIGAGRWLASRQQWRVPGGGRQEPARSAPASPRTVVAVLGFDNLTRKPEASYIEAALLQMLPTELSPGERLRLVPSEEIDRARRDLGIASARSLAADTLARLRERVAVDVVIAGSYLLIDRPAAGREVRCDLYIQDAATGETVAALQEIGTEDGLLDLVSRLGEGLRTRLGIGALSEVESAAVRAALPANAEVVRLYAPAAERLRRFEALPARDLLARALALDPGNPLLHSRLAAVWDDLGYDQKARSEVRQAAALATGLGHEERRQIEGQACEMQGDWAGAAAIYAELASYFPEHLDYGLRLARAQVRTGRSAAALATLDRLRQLDPPAGRDPRIDLAAAEIAIAVSSFERARLAAAAAVRKGGAQSALQVVARGRYYESLALRSLGRLQEAQAAAAESSRIARQAGDLPMAFRALNSAGSVLLTRGDIGGAQAAFEEVPAWSRLAGHEKALALALVDLGVCHRQQGDWRAARRCYEQAEPHFRAINDRGHQAAVLENLAAILPETGTRAEARGDHQQALAIYRQLGERSGEATVLLNLAQMALEEADLAGAQNLFARALALYREIGEPGGIAECEAGSGEVAAQRGQLPEARRLLAGAVAAADRAGETGTAARLRLRLARQEIAAGSAGAAIELARLAGGDAAAPVRQEAAVVLAAALFAAGREPEAAAAAGLMAPVLSAAAYRAARLEAEIIASRIHAASGEAAEAQRQLARTAAEARRHGLELLEYEARLTAAEAAPEERGAGARLAELGQIASARGLVLLQRRVAAAQARRLPPRAHLASAQVEILAFAAERPPASAAAPWGPLAALYAAGSMP
jgi:tetratricopeptide (TPR) repeat protein